MEPPAPATGSAVALPAGSSSTAGRPAATAAAPRGDDPVLPVLDVAAPTVLLVPPDKVLLLLLLVVVLLLLGAELVGLLPAEGVPVLVAVLAAAAMAESWVRAAVREVVLAAKVSGTVGQVDGSPSCRRAIAGAQ